MKIKFWQKLYLCTLLVFLIFFNSGVFVIVSGQNTKSLTQQKQNLLTQQEYILQQIVNDMALVYESRPLGIPMIIQQYGNRYCAGGILMQVTKGSEIVYTSFDPQTSFPDTDTHNRISEITDIYDRKYFVVQSGLPAPFGSYGTVLAFPVQDFFDNWHNTIFVINILCCAVSAVTAVVLYAVLRTLTKPIQDLSEAAVKFGKGDLSARIEKITDDEIGWTAQNFNTMAQQISTQMQALEATAQEKQNFIDDFSHEMRTPLTAIRGYAQYMQRARITDEEYYATLEIIDHNAGRLQNLSESMLALSLSQQTDGMDFAPVNLRTVLHNITLSYQPKLRQGGITMETSIDGDIFINGDFALVESLVGNLVDNAINACNAHSIPVKKVTVTVTQKGDRTVVAVKDNGIGMDGETLAKIHQPFYRQDKARSRKNGGAGLGGSITKKIADLHGAEISYTSSAGTGTTAKIEFTTL